MITGNAVVVDAVRANAVDVVAQEKPMPIIVAEFSDLPAIRNRSHPWGRSVIPLVRRIRAYMTAGTRKPEDIQLDRGRRLHMAYEADNPHEWKAWHLPYADIIGGRPAVVFRAIAAIINLLNGARGGLAHMLSAEQQDLVWGQCASYYDKWGAPMPERAIAKALTITLDVATIEQLPDAELVAEMRRQMLASSQAEIEKGDDEELLLTPDLDDQMMKRIEALEAYLGQAQGMLATARQMAEQHGIESHRAEIQRYSREVADFEAELGIGPEKEEGEGNKGSLMSGPTPPSPSPPDSPSSAE